MIPQMRYAPNEDLNWLLNFAKTTYLPTETDSPLAQEFPHAAHELAHAAGLFDLPLPRSIGGKEFGVTDLAWTIRYLSRSSPSAAATFIGNLLGLSAVLLYAPAPLRDSILSSLDRDRLELWSFAMTEADAGSDLMNIATRAVRQNNGGFILSGEKNFITNASYSRRLCVFARELDEAGNDHGISCFFVPGDAPGLRRGPVMSKTAWRKANTGTLIFHEVALAPDARLGEPGAGLRILTHCLNRSKTLLGAMGVGIADRALELVTARLEETERFGKSLIDQPVLRHELARHHTENEAAWLMTLKAAATWDAGADATTESSQAKWISGRTSAKITSAAVEYFGARGLFNDYEISRLSNDAKAVEIVEGPSLVQELLVGRALLPKRKTPAATGAAPKGDFILRPNELKKAV